MNVFFDNETIRNKREELRFFPVDIANDLNIDVDMYREIENGNMLPNRELAEKICSKLSIDIDKVFNDNIKYTKVINIFNAKGGVGKTSTVNSLAAVFAKKGLKTLCIDLDSQCNLTNSFELIPDEKNNIFTLFTLDNPFDVNIEDYIVHTKYDNIDIVMGSPNMDEVVEKITVPNGREYILYEALKNLIEKNIYDFILIDNAASSSLILYNSIYTCHYAIAPLVVGERFSLDGLNKLYDVVNKCLRNNYTFKDLKLFVNKYDKRVNSIDEFLDIVNQNYPESLLKSIVRIDAQIERAQKERKTIIDYNEKSKAAKDFTKLGEEIINLE